MFKKFTSLALLLILAVNCFAGLTVIRSSGISLTGADGVQFVGLSGISLTGADGFLTATSNGISLTGADGIPITSVLNVLSAAPNGTTYTGPNGISLTGADGISLTGADGISLTGADGISLTGADGILHHADSVFLAHPNGISLTGADGISLTGADGIALTGLDQVTTIDPDITNIVHAAGISLTGADGISLTGADGISLTGADSAIGFGPNGVLFQVPNPTGISLTGADGISLTGANGINLTGSDNIRITGIDPNVLLGNIPGDGLLGIDPELALTLNTLTDDSSVNAVVVYHNSVTNADITQLRLRGILGGTRIRVLPVIYVTATKSQLVSISHLASVRSIYGNRTLNFNSDPYFNTTGVQRVAPDTDLRNNQGQPYTGKGVTVAVLDTGINALHADFIGRIAQNVKLFDFQSLPLGFLYPLPLEGQLNSDLLAGHGTFVSGIIAGTGASSGGHFAGVAPGAKLLGLSAGDINLSQILSGFDYILDKGPQYGVRVVNCSFSAETVFDVNDPVNIATKMLTDRGVSVVFSAGNSGPGNSTLNPYAMAPWVISVGATDKDGALAPFSSRGDFGDTLQHPTLVAPGVDIASVRSLVSTTSVGGILGADPHRLTLLELPFYTTASGTSFSAPQVSGAIALMLEANPKLTPAEIKDILSRTATPLPKYFYHEVGAGMLNTHAAVIEAAHSDRRMGSFRSILQQNSTSFLTTVSQSFTQPVMLGNTTSQTLSLPPNTIQANIAISWGFSLNDFGLQVYNGPKLLGESNYLNLPLLTARREKVVLKEPNLTTIRADISHTLGIGLTQNVSGSLETTQVLYPALTDIGGLPQMSVDDIKRSLLNGTMMPEGDLFRPNSYVSRSEMATAFMRAGFAPQNMSGKPLFSDVLDSLNRVAVESQAKDPDGALFYDASPGGAFYPNDPATKLVAAVAYVRAAGLEDETIWAFLPASVTDVQSIPAKYRGYVAVALRHGFISVDGKRFNRSRAVTRLELATSLNRIISR